jgi:hypothetical protein
VTAFDGAAFALRGVVAVLAIMLARRRPQHGPIAALLATVAIVDPLRSGT